MKLCLKRIFDIGSIIICLPILLPLFLILSILNGLILGFPILFIQIRPGYHEKPFKLFKFRTMTYAKNSAGELLPDAQRLTLFGRFLRKTSLDELPELLNVLIGDMSLVGPRPLLMRYLPYFTNREKLRFSVLPGITGLAQISGRNTLNWNERLELDVQYVETRSFKLDIIILIKTIFKVILSDGVITDANTVMEDLDVQRKN